MRCNEGAPLGTSGRQSTTRIERKDKSVQVYQTTCRLLLDRFTVPDLSKAAFKLRIVCTISAEKYKVSLMTNLTTKGSRDTHQLV